MPEFHATTQLPAPVAEGPEVFPALLVWVEDYWASWSLTNQEKQTGREVLDELRARRDLGIARYGQTLHRDDGRPAGVDFAQELMDAAVYAQRELMRAEAEGRADARQHYADRRRHAVNELARQLEWMRKEARRG